MDLDDISVNPESTMMEKNSPIENNFNNNIKEPIFGMVKLEKCIINTSSKDRYKIPFLKNFNPKIIKREEIDKKIVRKFKKFLKEKIKLRLYNIYNPNYLFWSDFVNKNLLPPFNYNEVNEFIEFKSFNINYMVWLMSHNGSNDLYSAFMKDRKPEMIDTLKKMIKGNLNEHNILEFTQILEYMENFNDIFNFSAVPKYFEEPTSQQTEKLESTKGDNEIMDYDENIRGAVYLQADPETINEIRASNKSNERNSDIPMGYFQNIDFLNNYIREEESKIRPKEENLFENFEYSDDEFGHHYFKTNSGRSSTN